MPPQTRRNAFEAFLDHRPGRDLPNARYLPLANLIPDPDQPRTIADEDRLRELAADIAERGVLLPLIVEPLGTPDRPENQQYKVVAGGRRLAAAGMAGKTEVPCLIKEELSPDERRAIALVENVLREDLDIEDEARALQELHDQGKSLRAIAAMIHKSYKYVQRRLRLLEDPGALQMYRAGQINLEDLVSDRDGLGDDVPMSDLAGAAQLAGIQPAPPGPITSAAGAGDWTAELLQGSDFVTQRHNEPVLNEAKARRNSVTYKPFHTALIRARRINPATIPPDERSDFRRTILELRAELDSLAVALDRAD